MPRPNATDGGSDLGDLRGIGSHGISMLLNYDILRQNKKVTCGRADDPARDAGLGAGDGGDGLGYVPAR
jgi:hypothetical protein